MVKMAIADQRLVGKLIPPAKRSFTLLACDVEDKIRAAAEAGYDGVNLNQFDIEEYLSQKHGIEDVASLLNEYKMPLTEIGCPAEWHYEGEGRRKAIEAVRHTCSYASALDCSVAAAGLPPYEGNTTLAIRDFSEMCKMASDYGVSVALEFLGFGTQVKDMKTARTVVEECGAANGGISLDTHHFYRGGSTLEDLEDFPVEKIFSVHLCDVPHEWSGPGDCWDRPLPGQGVAPIKEMMDIVKNKGYQGFYTLEVLNYELWGKDPGEVARIGKKAMEEVVGG